MHLCILLCLLNYVFASNNDDSYKGRHHEQERRQQCERSHQRQQLQRQTVLRARFSPTDIDHWNALRRRDQRKRHHDNSDENTGPNYWLTKHGELHRVLDFPRHWLNCLRLKRASRHLANLQYH